MIITLQKTRHLASKLYGKEVLACLLLLVSIYFLRQQRRQFGATLFYLHHAQFIWLLLALAVTTAYILLQSLIYVKSFSALGAPLGISKSIELFLKRNLISLFLPGGGLTALAYTPATVKNAITEKIKIHQASALFAFAGLVSTFFVGLPVVFLNVQGSSLAGLVIVAACILLVVAVFNAVHKMGRLYALLNQRFPRVGHQLYEFTNAPIRKNDFYLSIASSVGVEICGIIHLYLCMLAVGATPSLQAAGIAYIVSVLLMVVSPFLKGLGAIELSIVYILGRFGYAAPHALAIAFIYRFFEFWLPLFCSVMAFLVKGKEIILRVFPAVLIFALGIINILSVVTPPVINRLDFVRSFVPVAAIHVTNLFVLFIGLTLLVTAAFLVKGRRSAWWLALIISLLSVPGHLIKALDYEEAIVALGVFASLLLTKKQYRSKSNPAQMHTGIAVAILSFIAVLIYGFIGFYFLEKKHFGLDFSWQQSIVNAVRGFFLLDPEGLHPLTRFGKEFLWSFHFLGVLAWLFLLYSLTRPYLHTGSKFPSAKEKAQSLLHSYGHSTVDYFKLSDDKLLFFYGEKEGFVAYRIAGNFAIALEEPVCALHHKIALLKEFDLFCRGKGLKTAFYRVDEDSLGYFIQLKKKKLLIGQEAVLDIDRFDLAGRSKKSLRNALNSLQKKGFTTRLCPAPQPVPFLDQLKAVSDDWLHGSQKKEFIFSQGSFEAETLAQQDVIACFDEQGKLVAFLNIIPDFAPGECTYDMIRKAREAPGGCMDALIIELIVYARQRPVRYINLGLVPLSGITQPGNTAEQVMVFAYNKIKRFKHYRGLREFKEKYATQWLNKYLIYEDDFDLLQLPGALNKVMQKNIAKLLQE